jgi:hypothetical protein
VGDSREAQRESQRQRRGAKAGDQRDGHAGAEARHVEQGAQRPEAGLRRADHRHDAEGAARGLPQPRSDGRD